jgi:phosphonate ABC transporter permease subunit PhnE
MEKKPSLFRSLLTGLLVVFVILVFAYGFQVTKVSFDQINSPTRQESLTRVLRALAHPDLFEYDQIETNVEVPIYVPCQLGAEPPQTPDNGEAYLVLTPACADPRATITIEGFNFLANSTGPVAFIPPSGVRLNLGKYQSDQDGYFRLEALLPPRPNEEVQTIRATTRVKTGSPYFAQSARDTWDKIVETVFLALLATAFGIILAVPISFFAARNLMEDIFSPMSSLALSVVGWPIGIAMGVGIANYIRDASRALAGNPWWMLAGIVLSGLMIYVIIRWALPPEETRRPGTFLRLGRTLALFLAFLVGILLIYLLTELTISIGAALESRLGVFSFLGTFIKNLAEIINLILALAAGLAGGGALSSALSRFGKFLFLRVPASWRLLVNSILGALAGGFLAVLIAAGLNWLYQFPDFNRVVFWFGGVGAALGVLVAILTRKQDMVPVGIVVYTVTRTVLNVLRAIEALIWVIIFVVWVGIGPFAGVLALALHTIAALAKLYSEQVESILPGPLEAVKATGATRLQTIVYAVIPQIVPPYISFTIYRWDINVRMSTIIGFAGGGGIGFLLFQNITLLNYRAASMQMLSIAIVVALMDYFSAYLRKKVV